MYIGQADVNSLQYDHISVVYMYGIHVQYNAYIICIASVTALPLVAHVLLPWKLEYGKLEIVDSIST